MKTWLAFLVIALAPLSQHCTTKSCTEVGCSSGVRMQASVAATPDDLAKTTLTVCRNADCSSGSPVVTHQICSNCSAQVDLKLTGALKQDAFMIADSTGTSFTLYVDINVSTEAERDALKDGDVYTMRLVPTTGAALVDVKETATYAQEYPNGVECDGPNGYCRRADSAGQ